MPIYFAAAKKEAKTILSYSESFFLSLCCHFRKKNDPLAFEWVIWHKMSYIFEKQMFNSKKN